MNDFFISPTKGKISFSQMINEIIKFVVENPEKNYQLIIGTDSEGKETPLFVSAIVIHKIGEGGRFFYKKIKGKKKYTLRTRIYEETMISLNLAIKIRESVEKELIKISPKNYKNLEIHTDIGQTGETREMIKEIVGMVKGNGFKVKIKPEAFGATVIADRCLK